MCESEWTTKLAIHLSQGIVAFAAERAMHVLTNFIQLWFGYVLHAELHRPGTAKEGRNTPTQRTATVDLNDSQPAPLTDQAPDTMAPPHTHPRVKL